MSKYNSWVLEITTEVNKLSMSLYEKQRESPLKTVNTVAVDFSRIESLKNSISEIINQATRTRVLDEALLLEFKKYTRLLYDLLLCQPVKALLFSLGQVELILSLDEILIGIPWELLYDGRDFFCLKFNLSRCIHTRSQEIQPRYRSIPYDPKMLIIADPTGDLKSAYQEGLRIKAHLSKKGKIRVDFKAEQVDGNYLRKNLRDYDIIHFAGHCEYNASDARESGWVLSDGWVSAREFLALGESGFFPSIVFANACSSARTSDKILEPYSQQSVFGLARAFLFAGARHYLGTFWRIEDNLSREFAEEFYSQIISGKSIAQAVRSARCKLVDTQGATAIAWAGYVLYGDPAFVLLGASKPVAAVSLRKILDLRRLSASQKKALVFSLVCLIVICGLLLARQMPSLSPAANRLFLSAKRHYERGSNLPVIELLSQATRADPYLLSAWRLKGDVYFRLGRFADALRSYFDYARLSEGKKDYKELASAYNKIAWTYHMWGDYPKSEEFYLKALALSEKNNDKLNEADALARLAVWHIDKGDNETAFSLLLKSSEINRRRKRDPEHKFNLACDYFNIAFLYTEKDDFAAAKKFYGKSRELFESLGEIPELSDYYFNMGEIALFEKSYASALEYYQKGLEIDEGLGHRFNLSSSYWMLGEFYWQTGKLREAEDYLKEAIFLSREIDNRPVLAGAYYSLGLMYQEEGKMEKAKEALELALEVYGNIETPDYDEVMQVYRSLE